MPEIPWSEMQDKDAWTLIIQERERQKTLGWLPDEGRHVELHNAAYVYETGNTKAWPWDPKFYKPRDHLNNLIRAGALYLAAESATPTDRRWGSTHVGRVTTTLDDLLDAIRKSVAT